MEDVSSSFPLINSNLTEEKSPQFFLKDTRVHKPSHYWAT